MSVEKASMTRFAHILVTLIYAMGAVVAALTLIRFGVATPPAAWAAAAFLTALSGALHAVIALAGPDKGVLADITILRRGQATLADEIDAVRGRVDDVETRVEEEAVERHAAIVSEMRTLEELVRELGDRMAARAAAARAAGAATVDGRAADRAVVLAGVRDALEAGRVDLHLQPVVSLPQRKTYFYESFSRLRDADGRIIMPSEWLGVAESAGLVSAIDNLLLFRCVQIVRRLSARERKVGIFCNVAPSSFADEAFFPQFLDFMRRNSDLAGSLIFEMGLSSFAARGHVAARNMARLADFGFRFSIDKVDDLDLDVADMQRTGVKFVKVSGDTLVDSLKSRGALGIAAAPGVAAEDYAALLAKHGIELIAEKVEDEATVVELLDLDLALAQGHLFGPPRPIREEILEEADARELQGQLTRKTG